jgi:hypothetical protein
MKKLWLLGMKNDTSVLYSLLAVIYVENGLNPIPSAWLQRDVNPAIRSTTASLSGATRLGGLSYDKTIRDHGGHRGVAMTESSALQMAP